MNISGRKTSIELARLLGLPMERLVSFTVHCSADDMVRIDALYLAQEPTDGAFAQVARSFKLTEYPMQP